MGLQPTVWWKFHNPNFNRFSMIPPSDGQTVGRAGAYTHYSIYAAARKNPNFSHFWLIHPLHRPMYLAYSTCHMLKRNNAYSHIDPRQIVGIYPPDCLQLPWPLQDYKLHVKEQYCESMLLMALLRHWLLWLLYWGRSQKFCQSDDCRQPCGNLWSKPDVVKESSVSGVTWLCQCMHSPAHHSLQWSLH